MKKFIAVALATLSAIAAAATLAACDSTPADTGNSGNNGGGNPSGGGKITTYTMEAEYTNLDGVYGGGHSSEASGVNMIYGDGSQAQKDMGWSNGYFVAFTHKEGVQLKFVFDSPEAVSNAVIVLRLGSEMGNLTFTPSAFEVSLNGTDIDYGSISLENSPVLSEMKFYDKTVTSSASLVKGENTLTLTVLANDLAGGTTAGPIIDCVKITTSAQLTWTDLTDNPGNRGAI